MKIKKLKEYKVLACSKLMELVTGSIDSDIIIDTNLKDQLTAALNLPISAETNSSAFLKKYATDLRAYDKKFNANKGIDDCLENPSYYHDLVNLMFEKFPFSYLSGYPVKPFSRSGLHQFSLDRLDNSKNHAENFKLGLLRVCTVTEQHLFPKHCTDTMSKISFLDCLREILIDQSNPTNNHFQKLFTVKEKRYFYYII